YILCFFQAEDGIRDATVTGVQTCALPISFLWYLLAAANSIHTRIISAMNICTTLRVRLRSYTFTPSSTLPLVSTATILPSSFLRSEERRVGKACSFRS